MSVQLVVDMNLSVEWVAELAAHGWPAVHWSTVGEPRADDAVIMAWALANGHVHDVASNENAPTERRMRILTFV